MTQLAVEIPGQGSAAPRGRTEAELPGEYLHQAALWIGLVWRSVAGECGRTFHRPGGTVKKHVASLRCKLGVRNRVGIAAWAWEARPLQAMNGVDARSLLATSRPWPGRFDHRAGAAPDSLRPSLGRTMSAAGTGFGEHVATSLI